jgi:uncharacterized protein (DUF2141 family)
MKKLTQLIALIIATVLFQSFINQSEDTHSLTVEVYDLRNSDGVIQYLLYNKEGSIPDKKLEKFHKKLSSKIANGTSSITFDNLPFGKYAVGVFHDENKNGEIDKGFIKPLEGIGYSNYESIGLSNKPKYSRASFELKEDKTVNIKVIYLSK